MCFTKYTLKGGRTLRVFVKTLGERAEIPGGQTSIGFWIITGDLIYLGMFLHLQITQVDQTPQKTSSNKMYNLPR